MHNISQDTLMCRKFTHMYLCQAKSKLQQSWAELIQQASQPATEPPIPARIVDLGNQERTTEYCD